MGLYIKLSHVSFTVQIITTPILFHLVEQKILFSFMGLLPRDSSMIFPNSSLTDLHTEPAPDFVHFSVTVFYSLLHPSLLYLYYLSFC